MREVEFRGKTDISVDDLELKDLKHKGQWVYGTYIDGFIINGVVEANEEYIAIETWCPVDTNTVGQYTGVKDIYGVKIFEGDIVEYEDYTSLYLIKEQPKVKGVISLGNFSNGIYLKGMGTFKGSKLEVIGNIHENLELLEEDV